MVDRRALAARTRKSRVHSQLSGGDGPRIYCEVQRKTLKRIKKNQKPSFFGTRENTCRKVFQQPAELRLQQVKMVDAAASQVLTRSSSARLLATELICASRPSHPAHSHHRRRPWRKRDGAHPTPSALHVRSCATLIMRVARQSPCLPRSAEFPTRKWTPGAGEAPRVSHRCGSLHRECLGMCYF